MNARVDGEVNIYMSYTIRNPDYVTADFFTGGSGVFSFYVPHSTKTKRQTTGGKNSKAFFTFEAKMNNTAITAKAAAGNVAMPVGKLQ